MGGSSRPNVCRSIAAAAASLRSKEEAGDQGAFLLPLTKRSSSKRNTFIIQHTLTRDKMKITPSYSTK